MLARTVDRVSKNTSPAVNARIQRDTEASIDRFRHASRAAVQGRVAELNREWDVERAIETEAPLMILSGLLLGHLFDRRFFALPAFAGLMLLLHNLQGWYPLLPLFRRLGFRTQAEIATERNALRQAR